jgi:hypothetical protein
LFSLHLSLKNIIDKLLSLIAIILLCRNDSYLSRGCHDSLDMFVINRNLH